MLPSSRPIRLHYFRPGISQRVRGSLRARGDRLRYSKRFSDAEEARASASIVEVAARAGVSLGTVSNVLNRPERVSPATRERVLAAIAELGYVRNEAARQLRAGHSRTVGLVVLDVGNPFFTDVAAGAEEVAAEYGLTVQLCNSGDDTVRETRHLQTLQEQRCFGVLITPIGARTSVLAAIRRMGTPVVLVDRGSNRQMCSVSVNDCVGGELAVGHLVAQGHRRLGFVGGPMSIKQVSERLTGARSAMREAGLRDGSLTVFDTPRLDIACGRAVGDRIVALPTATRPTAVFCANDLLALGLLQQTVRSGLRVPEDVAIIGYDDIDFAAAATVPLSSVRQPRADLGRAAMRRLIEESEQRTDHHHQQVVFEPQLAVRESTAGAGGLSEAI